MIYEKIKEHIQAESKNRTITDVRIGLSYCCIELDHKDIGVCHTFKDSTTCCAGRSSGILIDKTADKVIDDLGNTNDLIASSIAIATINAIVNNKQTNLDEGDIIKQINIKQSDTIGMVGCFAPLIQPLKKEARDLLIFERKESKIYFSENQIPKLLPQCQIAIITATALIDNKLEELLNYATNCREIVILGPTLPLLKDVYKPLGVTLISGIQVVNNEKIKQLISHGFGMGHFKETIKKVNIRLN